VDAKNTLVGALIEETLPSIEEAAFAGVEGALAAELGAPTAAAQGATREQRRSRRKRDVRARPRSV
jgi:hypothetical protein